MTRLIPASRFLYEWRASYCLERSDQLLHAVTDEAATFTRAATATGLDSAGANVPCAHSEPCYEMRDFQEGDSVKHPALLLGTSDRLYTAFGVLPAECSILIDYWEKTATGASNGSRILEIGDSSGNQWVSIQRSAGGFSALHRNASATVTGTVSVTAASGDVWELRIYLAANGSIQIAATKNRGTETVGSATSSNTLAAAWSQERLAIGSDYAGANRATQSVRRVRYQPGSRTLAYLRAG